METLNDIFQIDPQVVKEEFAKLDKKKQRDAIIAASKGIFEDNATPEEIARRTKIAMTDMVPIEKEWNESSSQEKKKLETAYAATGNKDAAVASILEGRKASFGDTPLKKVEYATNRDIYNALKEVYDRSGGDWDLVGKVIKYNDIPKELIDKFVKNGQWTDYSTIDESGSGFGAVARGATDSLYGGLANILTGGEYAGKFRDVVPQGITAEDAANTLWRAGIQQAEDYHKSLMETNPGWEVTGQLTGSLLPIGLASKVTKGIKAAEGASKLKKLGMFTGRGAATGALASIPGSLTEESLGGAIGNTLEDSLMFAGADLGLGAVGKGLGATYKGIKGATGLITKPSVHYREAFKKLKPLSEMTEEEIKIGKEKGWITQDGKLLPVKYLADEYGQGATEIMEDLWREARGNRETYDLLRKQVEFFNYRDAIKDAAKESVISNANFNRVNKILKELPDRLEKFSEEGARWYDSLSGEKLAQNMAAFNQDVKFALKDITNPSELEQKAINTFLKKVDSANMMQFMKKKMPSQFQAKDLDKSLFGEMANIFNINNPISQSSAVAKYIKNKANRKFMRQVLQGKKPEPNRIVKKLEESIKSKKTKDNIENLNRAIIKTTRGL